MAHVKTLVVQVPPETHDKLKLLAIARRTTLKSLLLSAIDGLPLDTVNTISKPDDRSSISDVITYEIV